MTLIHLAEPPSTVSANSKVSLMLGFKRDLGVFVDLELESSEAAILSGHNIRRGEAAGRMDAKLEIEQASAVIFAEQNKVTVRSITTVYP